MATYNDRPMLVEFLKIAYFSDAMKLRDYLLVMLGSNEIVATTRGRAIIHDKYSDSYQFLSASKKLDGWSCLDMAQVVDMLRVALLAGIANPATWLDEAYDPFTALLTTVPEYAKHKADHLKIEARSVDNQESLNVTEIIRAELYRPTDPSNVRSTARTLEHLKAFMTGMLRTLTNSTVATRYIDNGDMGVRMTTAEIMRVFKGTWRNANHIEGFFGTLKYFGGIFRASSHHTNAVASALLDHIFPTLAHQFIVESSKRKGIDDVSGAWRKKRLRDAKQDAGRLPVDQSVCGMMVDHARGEGKRDEYAAARARAAAADEASTTRRDEKEKKAEEKTIAAYIKAREKIKFSPPIVDSDIVEKSVVDLTAQLDGYLGQCATPAAKTRVIKGMLERFVLGMGFKELKPKYYASGTDAMIGKEGSDTNIAYLRSFLVKAFETIKEKKLGLVSVAAAPSVCRRQLPTVGEPTLQRVAIENEQLCSLEQLEAKADAAAAARPQRAASQRSNLPPVDQSLVERRQRIIVVWQLAYDVRGADGELTTHEGDYQCPGVIRRLSTANTKDGRRKLGLGHVWVEYDDGTKGWLQVNRPTFFNSYKTGGWWLVGEGEEAQGDSADEGESDGDAPMLDGEIVDHVGDDEEESDDDGAMGE